MRILSLIFAAAMLAIHPASAAGIADIAGNWKDPDTGAILAFSDCGGDLCATIAVPSPPDKKDDQNPDAGKRAVPLAGLTIMDHAKKSDETSWKGNLYNTNDGKTYSGYVTSTAPDKLQLKGCTLVVFCKTLVLTKAP